VCALIVDAIAHVGQIARLHSGRIAMKRQTSPAYQAMTGTARHMLELIEGELARCNSVTVPIRFADFVALGIREGSCGFALRQVVLFGFADVERGPLPARINTFRLSTRWQSIDATEAARLQVLARKPEPRPKAIHRPRTTRRPAPSMPRMPWDTAP
jgi:hypothetical protein